MALEDVIRADNPGAGYRASSAGAPSSSNEMYEKGRRVTTKLGQMGLTPETKHLRQAPLGQEERGPGGSGAGSSDGPKPIKRKCPLPPPPNYVAPETVLKATAKPKVYAKPSQVQQALIKTEPAPDFGEEVDLLGDERSPPDPPPGDGWEEYDDGGTKWYHYNGPKGQWCCHGPGREILPYDVVTMD